MNKDLIERWQAINLGPQGYCSEPIAELIADTIAALSAPLPDEVVRIAGLMRKNGDDMGADLIERLARKNKVWLKTIKERSNIIAEQAHGIEELETRLAMYDGGVTKETFERLDELEDKAASFEGSFNAAVKDIQRRDQRIEELEATARAAGRTADRLDAALAWVIKDWVDPNNTEDMLNEAKPEIKNILKARAGGAGETKDLPNIEVPK